MEDRVSRRTLILSRHLVAGNLTSGVRPAPCLSFTPPEASERFDFNVHDMRRLMDGHHVEERDRMFALMKRCHLFNPRKLGSRVFVSPDYNRPMEDQREITMQRIVFLLQQGVFNGWLTRSGTEYAMKRFAAFECLGIFDHSLAIKLGVHFFLWYAMSCAANDLKQLYVNRTAKDTKAIHVCSSAFKVMFTWHNMRTLQECREACGGQGLKTENRIGHLKGEYDVQSTFEGDNNVLLQRPLMHTDGKKVGGR